MLTGDLPNWPNEAPDMATMTGQDEDSSMSWSLDQTVSTPAGVVAYGVVGTGPPAILAHGWPWSSFSWHRLIPILATHFQVHWYDMPGYGRSEMSPRQPTSLDVQGEIFAFMLQHFDLERPSVIAHDFGGATVLRAHFLHGCEYEHLALMNVVAMRPWGSAFFDHVGRHVEAFMGLPSNIHTAVVQAYVRSAITSPIPNEDFEALCAPWLTEEGRISFYRQFAQADERYTEEIEPMFSDVRCPTLILWGVNDPWIPIDRGLALSEKIPLATFNELPRVGHLPQLEAPELVGRKLHEFLQPARI